MYAWILAVCLSLLRASHSSWQRDSVLRCDGDSYLQVTVI